MQSHLTYVLDRASGALSEALTLATASPNRGNLKRWAEAHAGTEILTYQWNYDPNDPSVVRSYWQPGARKLSTRATAMILDGSIRDYAGVKTIYADNQFYVGYSDYQVIVFATNSNN